MASVAQKQADTSTTIRPLGDRVVVRPVENEEMTKSGIYLPDSAKEKPQRGIVLAVGNGKLLDNGKQQAPDVKVGDRVLYAKYAGTEIKQGDDELIILRESDILAIIND
jgi:chaperonin GroES